MELDCQQFGAKLFIVTDLPPAGPSFITRVYRLELGFRLLRLAQSCRARNPQIAQALGALVAGSGCPARSAV